MAGNIRMTPDQMEVRAKEYDTQAGAVHDVISKMDTLLKQLQGEWEGQAATAYAQRFSEVRPSFVKTEQLIGEIAQALRSTAKVMRETDQQLANAYRG